VTCFPFVPWLGCPTSATLIQTARSRTEDFLVWCRPPLWNSFWVIPLSFSLRSNFSAGGLMEWIALFFQRLWGWSSSLLLGFERSFSEVKKFPILSSSPPSPAQAVLVTLADRFLFHHSYLQSASAISIWPFRLRFRAGIRALFPFPCASQAAGNALSFSYFFFSFFLLQIVISTLLLDRTAVGIHQGPPSAHSP